MNSDIVSEFWKNYLDDLLAECREIGRLPPQHRVRELGKLRAARRELIKCIWNDALAEARARATDTHRAEAVERGGPSARRSRWPFTACSTAGS